MIVAELLRKLALATTCYPYSCGASNVQYKVSFY